jgi:alkylation response protein AidB-like acyl-CoA dehydrogenase
VVEPELSEDQEAIREVATSVGLDVLAPASADAQSNRAVPSGVWRTLSETGLVAPVAVEYGGGGIPDPVSSLVVAEGLAHGDPAIAAAALSSGAAAVLIGEAGTPAQCAELLPPFVIDAGWRGSVALYEGFGRSPSEYRTTIQATESGWRVRGQKLAVPFGDVADVLVVVGTDPAAGGRLRAALVPAHDPGVTVLTTGSHMGLEAARSATLEIDASISADQLVGGPDGDVQVLSRVISRLRLLPAAIALGAAQRAREYASDYATGRVAFGRPISSFQGVAFLMAEAQIQLDAARMQLWEVAAAIDNDEPSALEHAVSRAVSYAGSVTAAATRDAVQVLGGHGFITDHPVERWYRATATLSTLDFDPSLVSFASVL